MFELLFEKIDHDDLKKHIQGYYSYAKKQLKLDRNPKVFLNKNQENADNILGKTGYYDPDKEEIHLFITDRHPKDVLRSFAHELIHHEQNLSGFNDSIDLSITAKDPSYMLHDEGLKEAERDAFERGNMMFRTWTDTKKMEKKNMLNEKKDKKKMKEGSKPDFLDLDKDGNKKEPMKSAAKQAKKGKKMKKKVDEAMVKSIVASVLNRINEEIEDDEEELDIAMSKPKYKAGMSDFEYGEKERGKRGSVDTGDEASLEDIEGLEIDDDESEVEMTPKRGGGRAKVDPYDSATSFDRNFKEREKALRAQSRASADDEPLMSDEELDALIAKRAAEKEAARREMEADPEYQAMLADLDKEEMQESRKNPYPVLFEQRERLLNEAFKTKEERVYNELVRRFIKK
jgi:hypothetical protein